MRNVASGVHTRQLQAANRSTPAPKLRPWAIATVSTRDVPSICNSCWMRTNRQHVCACGSVSMPVKSKPAEKFLPFPSRMITCKELCSAESSTPCNSSTSSDDKAFRFSGRFSLICNTVASCPTTSRLFTLQLPGGQRGLQFSVVLSQCRRPHTRLLGLAIQAYGRHEAARPLPVGQVQLLDPLHMLNLRIGQDFGIAVDGCAGHP